MSFPAPKKGSFKDLVGGLLDVVIPCTGEEICYSPLKGGVFTFDAVFDKAFFQIDPDTEEVIASNALTVGIKDDNIPYEPEQGDKVTIKGFRFKVTDAQEDGQGGSTIFLHKDD